MSPSTGTEAHIYPPLQNYVSKLSEHLLPHVQAQHQQEAESLPTQNVTGSLDGNLLFLKNDCIDHHKRIQFHYTTYDVRHGTDIVNAGTSRCNVMLLVNDTDSSSSPHRFLYARVLGAYHTNVIYTGPGMQDHKPHHFDFLWVQWFEVVDPASSGWSNSTLDMVRFPPMHCNGSFGFVDPGDVLCGCHILPAFVKGKQQADGVSVSCCAKDGTDYHLYYVGRYVQIT